VPSVQYPFRKLIVYVRNPTKDPLGIPITTPMRVIMFGAGYWTIENLDEFKKSVRELSAPL
jgi:hypothetical protein